MSIFLVSSILCAAMGSFCLFRVQYLRDRRIEGRYIWRVFCDFTSLNSQETKILILGFSFFIVSIFLAILQGSG